MRGEEEEEEESKSLDSTPFKSRDKTQSRQLAPCFCHSYHVTYSALRLSLWVELGTIQYSVRTCVFGVQSALCDMNMLMSARVEWASRDQINYETAGKLLNLFKGAVRSLHCVQCRRQGKC